MTAQRIQGKAMAVARAITLRAALPVTLTAFALLCAGTASADWEFDPMLRVAWDYDDNATLSVRTDQEEQISGAIGEASVDFRNRSERGFFSLRPTLRSRRYNSDLDRDSDDQFLDIRAAYNGARHDFRLVGDYSREAVRTAELADANLDTGEDPGDIPDDDTGRISSSERRERLRFNPRWSYNISDVSTIDADVNFLTVDYSDRQPLSGLYDYTDARLRLSYRRNFSSRNTGLITLTARDYTTERANGDRTGYGVEAGFNRALSETTEFRALVGVEQTDREDIAGTSSTTDPNFVTDISLTRRLETISLLAQYRQRVAPSGRGDLTKRDEFNLRFTRDLNDRFSAGLGVRAYQTNSVDGQVNEQDYVQLRGQVIWRLTQAFSMQADYRYTVLNRAVLGEGANSNRISVWFTYQPNPLGRNRQAISR